MTTQPQPLPRILSTLSTALNECMVDNGQRYIANIIGHGHSTVSRRGADVNLYSIADGLLLARKNEAFRLAMIDGLGAGVDVDPHVSTTAMGFCGMTAAAQYIQQLSESLRDGVIDYEEYQAMRPAMDELINFISNLKKRMEKQSYEQR